MEYFSNYCKAYKWCLVHEHRNYRVDDEYLCFENINGVSDRRPQKISLRDFLYFRIYKFNMIEKYMFYNYAREIYYINKR